MADNTPYEDVYLSSPSVASLDWCSLKRCQDNDVAVAVVVAGVVVAVVVVVVVADDDNNDRMTMTTMTWK